MSAAIMPSAHGPITGASTGVGWAPAVAKLLARRVVVMTVALTESIFILLLLKKRVLLRSVWYLYCSNSAPMTLVLD